MTNEIENQCRCVYACTSVTFICAIVHCLQLYMYNNYLLVCAIRIILYSVCCNHNYECSHVHNLTKLMAQSCNVSHCAPSIYVAVINASFAVT
jgi:hypothetical protein